MEPIFLTFATDGEFKQFEPSLSETFIYVVKGRIRLVLGMNSISQVKVTHFIMTRQTIIRFLMHMMMKQKFYLSQQILIYSLRRRIHDNQFNYPL